MYAAIAIEAVCMQRLKCQHMFSANEMSTHVFKKQNVNHVFDSDRSSMYAMNEMSMHVFKPE